MAEAKLYDDVWGFNVCCTLSDDKAKNQERFLNGKAYNAHFRVYNPDLKSTRVCCRSDVARRYFSAVKGLATSRARRLQLSQRELEPIAFFSTSTRDHGPQASTGPRPKKPGTSKPTNSPGGSENCAASL